MGMAASQARYLALVARKSNCEYEGQQINQARTVLSNQSANLFNQMLGLEVPVPPSTSDYTKTQYSYKDGTTTSTISDWQQLSSADPDYNYVVTHYYETDKYTGSQKKLSDPQVQFSSGGTGSGTAVKEALDKMTQTYEAYTTAKNNRVNKEKEAATLSEYSNRNRYTGINYDNYDSTANSYSIRNNDMPSGEYHTFVGYEQLSDSDKTLVLAGIKRLIGEGALSKDADNPDMSNVYFNSANGDIAFKSDLDQLYGGSAGGTSTTLPVYNLTDIGNIASSYDDQIDELRLIEDNALAEYNAAEEAYNALKRPTYVGNCELTPLAGLTADQEAEINQIIADMKEEKIDDSISKCFNANGEYTGGIYSFKLNGVTYYTTYSDLETAYNSGTGNNNIDGQTKLPYYNASYISTKVEKTEKALLETDGNGRFTSVRFEDDSVTYTLSMETVTDDAAYQDAMNQYYYDNAVYDKTVQDINAKTSLIQQEDQQLELRLKQLDTEQNALSTEIDAVKKVVDDNVESSFKTFGG